MHISSTKAKAKQLHIAMFCFATWQNFTKQLPVNHMLNPLCLFLSMGWDPKVGPKKLQKLASESYTRYASQPEFQVKCRIWGGSVK
jgi:hypothetical protein